MSSSRATRGDAPQVPPAVDERAAPAGPAFGNIDRILGPWLVAGVLAGLAMMAIAMLGSWLIRRGFYTPLYQIASVYDRVPLDFSLAQAADGHAWYYRHEPMVLGMAIQVTFGGLLGLVFGLAVRALRPYGRRKTLLTGVAYGLIVMAIGALAFLPLIGRMFGAGEPITQMPLQVGLPLFALEFVVFGLVLGLWAVLRPHDVFATPRPLKG